MRLNIAGIGTVAGCDVSHPRETLFPSESSIITFNNKHPLGSVMAEKATIGEDSTIECDDGRGECDCPIPSFTIPIYGLYEWIRDSNILGDDEWAENLADWEVISIAEAMIDAMGGQLTAWEWLIPCRDSDVDMWEELDRWLNCQV